MCTRPLGSCSPVDEQDRDGDRVSTFSLSTGRFGSYISDSISDVRLVDEAAGETLAPLQVNVNRCLCSTLTFQPLPGVAGQQALFVTFPAPAAGNEQVAVRAGDFPLTPPVDLTPPGSVAFADEPIRGRGGYRSGHPMCCSPSAPRI